MVTINIGCSSRSPLNSHPLYPTGLVDEVTQQVAAARLSPSSSSFPPPPLSSLARPPRIDDEEDWDALYPPIPENLDIGAKPWLPSPHRSYHLISELAFPHFPPPFLSDRSDSFAWGLDAQMRR